MFKFENGETVRDIITNFEGVIMARVDYMTGCNQYGLSPRKFLPDGKRPDWEYFDESRLIAVKKPIIKILKDEEYRKGFDGSHPNKRS